jgi:uncharacterized protein YgiM (DUF1202 family)
MKKTIIRSVAIVLFSSAFLLCSSSASYAHFRHFGPAPRIAHGFDLFAPLEFGLLAGAIVGSAFIPQPPTVVYQQPPPTVVYQQPPVVVTSPPPVQYYTSTPEPPAQTSEMIISQVGITTPILNVRSGPGLENTVVDQVKKGQVLDVVGENPGWLYVRTPAGVHGWVMDKYTTVRATPAG